MKRYLLTSALPYANGFLHLGHCAGAYLPADIFARFLRLSGEKTLYVCGSDEHGVAITIAAEKEKVSPQEIIDKYHFSNKSAFEKLGMSFDIYSRTSIAAHHEIAREFFGDFLKKGFLLEKEKEQFYDETANMFLPDRYVEGICPNCDSENARGDQCDNCGAYYSQTELKNPISLVSNQTPTLRKTTHWFLQFDKFQEFLDDYIEGNAQTWKDNVLQQTRSWLKAGLTERAITRDLDWGVHLDGIEGVDDEKVKGKALYVWFDAVLGYISATKEFFKDKNEDEWKNWWQNEDTSYIAFIGKDNIVFHTLIFPAMLHGRKDEDNPYVLPENVPAHEFLNLEGQKFSKSRNWSIDLKDFVRDFPEGSYIDALRYTLSTNFPETKDADFTWKDYQARNNNELAAILGNYVNRVLTFLNKNFDGIVPDFEGKDELISNWEISSDKLSENETLLNQELKTNISLADDNFRKFRFRDAISNIMNVARASNKYFNDEEPWKSLKTDKNQTAKTMFVCCQLIETLATIVSPVIPYTGEYLQGLLGKSINTGEPNESLEYANNLWSNAFKFNLKSGLKIDKPKILFSRIEDEFVESQIAKLGDKKTQNSTNNKSDKKAKNEEDGLISFEDFMNVKLRTAKVIEAEAIKKSDKLLKLQVDLGSEKRQIVAGIAKFYSPEQIIGKTVVVVANLKPAKLMGQKSEGMLLAANGIDGSLTIISPLDDVENGTEVR